MTFYKKTVFNPDWIDKSLNPRWSDVYSAVPNDVFRVKCNICNKALELSNMGKRCLSSHEKSAGHKKRVKSTDNNNNLPSMFKKNPVQHATENKLLEGPSNPSTSALPNTVSNFLSTSRVMDAEILWCLNIVYNNISYNSSSSLIPVLKAMFPDSSIAGKMSLGYTKAAYTVCYGLAPFFKCQLEDVLKNCDAYVICFDEALNKIIQKGQMDLVIKFFNNSTNMVETRYFTSVYMKYTTAADILKYFLEGVQSLHLNRILQISMDGPSVNWKFFSLLKEHRLQSATKKILDIGSCGLHIIHGALQTGHKAAGWQVNEFLRGIYYLFKDSPKRRADFQNLTECNYFPQKFCVTRWVENHSAATRAIEILDNIKTYVEHPKTKLPGNISVTHVKSGCKDLLIKPKLAFFSLIAGILEPFLKKYQTANPMLPFLKDDLELTVRNLLRRIVKVDTSDLNIHQILEINLENACNLKSDGDVDVGFETKRHLKNKKLNEKAKLLFLKDCKHFLKATVKKISERCCLKYPLVHAVAALNPKTMSTNSVSWLIEKFNQLLEILHDHEIITSTAAEQSKNEYEKFIKTKNAEIASYKVAERLDAFYFRLLVAQEFENLWDVIKLILIMSHGNASVEAGFSINKNLLVENLKEESLTCLRIVYDAVHNKGGVLNVGISEQMRSYVKKSCYQYKLSLEQKRKEEQHESAEVSLKRKAKQEIYMLESKQKKLERDANYESNIILTKIAELRKQL